MNKPKFGYGWLIKWILAAILISVGVMVVFEKQIVYMVTGIAIVLFSLLRVVPLLKTLKKEVLRTVNLIEVIFDTIMGIVMILAVALWWPASGQEAGNFWYESYGYLVAGFLYARAFIYFISMYFFGEKTEAVKFWSHLGCITLAPAILVLEIMSDASILATISWILLFISIAGGVYLGFDGLGGYRKYREEAKKLNEEKKKIEAEKQPVLDKPVEQPQVNEPKKPEPKVEEPKEKEVPIS